jgi:N-acetylglutamate synthase-like GNAT family acetyltransferase
MLSRLTSFKANDPNLTISSPACEAEWGVVCQLRQPYFFDPSLSDDPCQWTFHHEDHFHLLLKMNKDIIGYAALQFWPNKRAALRLIVIREEYRYYGVGTKFLNSIETWLISQDIESIHIQASLQAQTFYEKNHYMELPFNDPDGEERNANYIEMGKILNK